MALWPSMVDADKRKNNPHVAPFVLEVNEADEKWKSAVKNRTESELLFSMAKEMHPTIVFEGHGWMHYWTDCVDTSDKETSARIVFFIGRKTTRLTPKNLWGTAGWDAMYVNDRHIRVHDYITFVKKRDE